MDECMISDQSVLIRDRNRSTMKNKRVLQIICVVCLIVYAGMLVSQIVGRKSRRPRGNQQSMPIIDIPIESYRFDRNLAEDRSPHENEIIPEGFTSEISTATATVKPPTTTLDDVFISVKTTKNYHRKRLPIILKTWFQLARKQVRSLENVIL
ncbi:unnamed protein product [Acanthoscelides obtectus]|uniref:Fringe-like glycosyltransferase domain-containing protein n=1 Tax=Acanthoscelides obtectus TaxID=200917 RepID=A0A9P0KXC3_ACAOB|nr:unnamed protein product [Acanthoscelides obtectus]CAK1622215.1 Fringe glycosyltransferase [Acanthoscelides obtectus]